MAARAHADRKTVDVAGKPGLYVEQVRAAVLDQPMNGIHEAVHQPSFGVDINNSGQVIGTYDISFPDDEFFPLRTRSFIATPISLLFSRLSGTVGKVSSNKNLVAHLQTAQGAYTTQKQKAACDAFYAFELEARSLQTRGKISASVADNLVRRAQDIATPIGCNLTAPL